MQVVPIQGSCSPGIFVLMSDQNLFVAWDFFDPGIFVLISHRMDFFVVWGFFDPGGKEAFPTQALARSLSQGNNMD